MKIVVDKLPESSEDCLFSHKDILRNHREVYVCSLHTYVPQVGCKPNCICHPETCELLKEVDK